MDKVNKQELRRLAEFCGKGGKFNEVLGNLRAFSAAANPAAILSLLDELEQAEERIAGLEIETLPLSMLRTSYQVHKALVEAAGCETIEQLAEQRDSALAELEQYRKDAERYRRYRLGKVSPELLDAAIDAAMAKEGGANG